MARRRNQQRKQQASQKQAAPAAGKQSGSSQFAMNHSFYIISSTIAFLMLGIVHAIRGYYEWSLTIGFDGVTYAIPAWISWIVVLLAFLLAFGGIYHLR